jgi:membrane-bound serine protease (ClpP class)
MAALVLVHLVALAIGADRAGAGGVDDPGFVSVVKVSGLIDRVLASFVEDAVTDAEDDGAIAIVLQVNSSGAVVSEATLDHLTSHLERADVPVTVWVGPSGSEATGDATRLLAAADVVGVAPGSKIEVTGELLAAREATGVAVGDRLGAKAAVEASLVDTDAPVLVDFIGDLDGVRSKVIETDSGPRRQPTTQVRFAQLPLSDQLMHTVSSPAVAYLLFVIGLALIVFELFTAGIGVAGVVGAGSLVLGSYGLAALPTSPLAVGLILLAMFGYSVDVQTGVPRFWSGLATVLFVIGSLILYDGVSVSWITLLVAIVGMTLAMIGGMPAMVRSRFSTPTIGREWIVGEVGTAQGSVAPDGVVTVRDAPWRARTNRATPIAAGQAVKVVSIDGLVLEVEPEDGGARDHRERRADRA